MLENLAADPGRPHLFSLRRMAGAEQGLRLVRESIQIMTMGRKAVGSCVSVVNDRDDAMLVWVVLGQKERDLVTSVRVGDQAQGKLATGV